MIYHFLKYLKLETGTSDQVQIIRTFKIAVRFICFFSKYVLFHLSFALCFIYRYGKNWEMINHRQTKSAGHMPEALLALTVLWIDIRSNKKIIPFLAMGPISALTCRNSSDSKGSVIYTIERHSRSQTDPRSWLYLKADKNQEFS